MTKDDILKEFDDINFVYNDCSKHDTLSNMLDELIEDWQDVPSDEMTLEQARQAVKDLRKKLADLSAINGDN